MVGYCTADLVQSALDKYCPWATIVYEPVGVVPGGCVSDAQADFINYGTVPQVIGQRYFIACRDGRRRPSVAEALEWGDDPSMSHGFKGVYDATGIDTVAGQAAWHEWAKPYRNEYKSRPGKNWAFSESFDYAVAIWKETKHDLSA